MKKTVVLVIIFFGVTLFSGCFGTDIRDYIPGMWDPHKGERPTDYPHTKWISQSPNIWFEVIKQEDNSENTIIINPKGQVVIDEQITEVSVCFDRGRTIFFYNADGESGLLFTGTCKFSPEKLVIKVDKKGDFIFNGKYDEITFTKES